MSRDASNAMSQPGAKRLARTITRYWRNLGGPVPNVWAEPVKAQVINKDGTFEAATIWAVKSDMVGGKPNPAALSFAA